MARPAICKALVSKGDPGPGVGIVTGGTLTRVVITGRCMARLTIRQAAVAKVDVDPVGSAVAARTLTGIVTGWGTFAVAAGAV